MKICFIGRKHENLGVEILSAFAKKHGIATSLVFDPGLFDAVSQAKRENVLAGIFNQKEKVVKEIGDIQPDIAAFSVFLEDYRWACDLAGEIKKRFKNIKVIFGGTYPTSVPEAVIKQECVDYVCIGEGEAALAELTQKIRNGTVPANVENIWSKDGGQIHKNAAGPVIKRLDDLPFADKELFYRKYRGFQSCYSIQTSRGCYYDCTYCVAGIVRDAVGAPSDYVRRRSVSNVIEELLIAKHKYNPRQIFFVDDLFADNFEWMKEFMSRYKQCIDVPFVCNVMPFFDGEHAETFSLLKRFRKVHVAVGVQSINERQRKHVLRRKGTTREIAGMIDYLKKSGVYLSVEMLVGVPGQTPRELIGTALFFNKYRPDAVNINWIRYYPKAAINKIALDSGIITPREYENYQRGKIFSHSDYEGNYPDKILAKLGNLCVIAHLLPAWLLAFIIRTGIYHLFPGKVPHSAFLFCRNAVVFLKSNKIGFGSLRLTKEIRFYLAFFMQKNIV